MVLKLEEAVKTIGDSVPDLVAVSRMLHGDTGVWRSTWNDGRKDMHESAKKLLIKTPGESVIIDVPELSEKELYEEWLVRSVKGLVLKESMEYKVYATFEYTKSEGFSIYTPNDSVFFEADEKTCELWWRGEDKTVKGTILNKEDNGVRHSESIHGMLHKHITNGADLHEHPGNQHLHPLGILLPTPRNAYVGKGVYYDPANSDYILISVAGDWVWASAQSVLRKKPKALQDELTMLEQLFRQEKTPEL